MPAITLLLHNIRSTHNVGSIFRTADGFGVKNIVFTGYTPYPSFEGDHRLPHLAEKIDKQIRKTALGATDSIPFEQYDDVNTWLNKNIQPLIALEQSERSQLLPSYTPPSSDYVVVLGEEVSGIPLELLRKCEDVIEIPMNGEKESFNVSVATGIALYALTT